MRQNAATNIRQEAPGRLEVVRTFLNTWEVPSDTRTPTDSLPTLGANGRAWDRTFPGVRKPRGRELDTLISLRDGLRESVESRRLDPEWLNRWLRRVPLTLVARSHHGGVSIEHVPPPGSGLDGAILAAVAEAIGGGAWARLKACPDCRWVSYDWTKNASKVWCRMYAGGPHRRACGSIAKVRRYRKRAARRAQGASG